METQMKNSTKSRAIFLALISAMAANAQNYSIDWYKIADGGGSSSGGQYSLNGTIGQPDASAAMAGGGYSVTGGFWSLIAVVQTAGVPNLTIAFIANGVTISWPDTGTYTLLQNSSLAGGSWITNTSSIAAVNGTNSITITPPSGNLFFRLK
jgi:hypothetical protein